VAEDFYDALCRETFQTTVALAGEVEYYDCFQVQALLVKRGVGESQKLLETLTGWMESVPSAVNVGAHAQIVLEASRRRAVIAAAMDVLRRAYDPESELTGIVGEVQRRIVDMFTPRGTGEPVLVKDILPEVLLMLDERATGHGRKWSIGTGYTLLDAEVAFLIPGGLTVLAARPSMGKTTFALNLLANITRAGMPAALFTLETGRHDVVRNLLSLLSRIEGHRIRSAKLLHSEFDSLQEAVGKLSTASLYIDDSTPLTVEELRARCRWLTMKHKIELISVDYLQLLRLGQQTQSMVERVTRISAMLKTIARELEVPILALSQLSRDVEHRDNHRPQLSDLRESGALEQDADVVAFLYREDYYNPKAEAGPTEIIVRKNRNGPVATVILDYDRKCFRFSEPKSDKPEADFWDTEKGETK